MENTPEVIKEEKVINPEETKDLLSEFYLEVNKALGTKDKKPYAKYFYKNAKRGNSKYYHKNITETKAFDEVWIKTLESFFPSIDRIITNPKSTIKYEQEVVAVEKAKKIDSSSVRHLASHTHLIKEVRGGDVIPKKILTTFAEEDLATYENRFVMTLIDRLTTFVNNRAIIIRDNVESFQKEHMNYVDDFKIKGTNVTLNIDVVVKKDLEDKKINEHNYQLLEKVERLKMLINGYKNSPFMHALGKAKKVNSPIMKTNVILKNADFRNAYTLWLFLDRYNGITYDVDVQEREVPFNAEYIHDLERISLLSYTMLQDSIEKRAETFIDLNDVPKVRLKSTKIVKTNPADVLKDPDAIKIVDNTINEYYLEAYKKLISKRIKEYINQDLKDEVALKKAIEDTTSITNILINELFNVEDTEEEIDYFNKMVTLVDPIKDLEVAKNRANLIKIIRTAKENDYKDTIKLEKKILKEMEKAQTAIIKADRARKKMATTKAFQKKIDADTKRNKVEREKVRQEILALDGKVVDMQTNRTMLQQEREDMKLRVKNFTDALKASDAIELQNELDVIEKEHEEKMKAMMDEMKNKLSEAKKRYNAKVQELKLEEKKLKEVEKQETAKKHQSVLQQRIAQLREIEAKQKAALQSEIDTINEETNNLKK